MKPDALVLSLVGLVLAIGALMRRPWSVRIGKSTGNVVAGGSIQAGVIQQYTSPEAVKADTSTIGVRELITWLIAILGLVLTGVGLYLNYFRGR